ncbi:MAG: hypothetical protein EPN92_04820 [Chitinophagaceae bacterium]|nr:MAG: hypothetical protein EPN92_04820 [Chitinophagaceae bacterium]
MKYTLFLKNEKSKSYRIISQLIIFFNLLGFIFLLSSSQETIKGNLWIILSIIVTGLYTFFIVVEWISKKALNNFWHRFIFGYCAIAWLIEGYWWLSAVLIVFVILDVLAHKKLLVEISDKQITLPSIIKQKVEWSELSNVILKDGLLTIDFKNNKLFQHLILNPDPDIDENKFNEFCKSRLTK